MVIVTVCGMKCVCLLRLYAYGSLLWIFYSCSPVAISRIRVRAALVYSACWFFVGVEVVIGGVFFVMVKWLSLGGFGYRLVSGFGFGVGFWWLCGDGFSSVCMLIIGLSMVVIYSYEMFYGFIMFLLASASSMVNMVGYVSSGSVYLAMFVRRVLMIMLIYDVVLI